MLNIEHKKVNGFTSLIDSGSVRPNHIRGLFNTDCHFMVLKKLGTTVTDIFDSNMHMFKKIDILKLGI
jgi:hypothetical protein